MSKIAAISVLIPNYNHLCLPLVTQLQPQLEAAVIPYEIIVAEDGSTDSSLIEANSSIAALPCCRYIVRSENVGRAAIRNFLALEAQYEYLLFIDSDMTVVRPDFISRYLAERDVTVIDGGVSIGGDPVALRGCLRFRYEKAEESSHTAEQRQASPYQHLHTANLLIRRDLMLAYPFDERFRHYGYEDVLLGKTLRRHRVVIRHIDNPMGFCTFEDNGQFVAKTEESLRTLHEFRDDLRGYSRLLTFVAGIHVPLVRSLIRLWHRLFQKAERRNLCGPRPSLLIFKIYRLGYYLSISSSNHC